MLHKKNLSPTQKVTYQTGWEYVNQEVSPYDSDAITAIAKSEYDRTWKEGTPHLAVQKSIRSAARARFYLLDEYRQVHYKN